MRENQAFPAIRPGTAFVRVAAMHDQRDSVEGGLEEALVRIVANGIRHHATGIGNHAVAGDDNVAFDAAHGDPYWREDCVGPSLAGSSIVAISVSTASVPAMT